MEINKYNVYSDYLKNKYGQKVYKLPINLPLTCPNRDGNLSRGGCTFCGEEGGSFENLENTISVKDQLYENMTYIRHKYKANKFIAYFQNFSNTYMPLEKFKVYVNEAIIEDVVAISISTRPDCIEDNYLQFLSEIHYNRGIDIIIEIGLQTINYSTLKKINRGHGIGEFIDAILRIKRYSLRSCVHVILNLPWDSKDDVIETSKVISALKVDEVKLHSLYLMENTLMAKQYSKGEFKLTSKEEYMDRVILFLEYLDPNIVIQRIIGRAPKENSIFVNWQESWWKIKDDILTKMDANESYQGKKFDYLNGKALKNINKE